MALPLAAIHSRERRPHDPLLDLWRGMALINMAWVHLALYPIGMPAAWAAWIGEYTRFAAGAFVLLAGTTVARVFGRSLRDWSLARATRLRLLRRAILLLFLDRAVSVVFAAIEQLRVAPTGWIPIRPDLWRIAIFQDAGVTGGLLLLYACLLTLVPLLAVLHARHGNLATLLISIAIYGSALAIGSPAHWLPWTFPLAHWQPIFVIGYLSAPYTVRLGHEGDRLQRRLLAGTAMATAVLFVLRNGAALNIAPSLFPAAGFTKVPLQPAEMLWYLCTSGFILSWSAWIYGRWRRVRIGSQWLCRLGKWSLLVYVAHLFLEIPVVEFLALTDPSPLARISMLVVTAVFLSAVAITADQIDRWRPSWGARLSIGMRPLLPTAGAVGSGVAVATIAGVLTLQFLIPPPRHWGMAEPDQVVEIVDSVSEGEELKMDVEATGDQELAPMELSDEAISQDEEQRLTPL